MSRNGLYVRDLGRMPYREAFDLQKRLQRQVIDARGTGAGPMHVLLLEHEPPVITVSRRRGAGRHLLVDARTLAEAGVEVCETDRGGDITYHGPGQLVVYPILDLNALGLRLHDYMRWLEQAMIDTIARFGVRGRRDAAAPGVWVGAGAGRKICAMGVRVARWVTMHGAALNVRTDLDHFRLIVPCGLAGREVTSLERELGPRCPDLPAVKAALSETLLAAVETRLATQNVTGAAAPGSAPSSGARRSG